MEASSEPGPTNSMRRSRLLADEIRKNTVEPARELGVTEEVAITTVIRYAANLVGNGRYRGCIDALEKAGRYRKLCDKLYMDAHLVIPGLFGTRTSRFHLENLAEAEWNRCKKDYGAQIATTDAGDRVYNPLSGMYGPLEDPNNGISGHKIWNLRNRMLRTLSRHPQPLISFDSRGSTNAFAVPRAKA